MGDARRAWYRMLQLSRPTLREPDPADARGSLAVLTDDGAQRLTAARVTHDAVIDEIIGAPLTRARAATFARTLDQLASARSSVA